MVLTDQQALAVIVASGVGLVGPAALQVMLLLMLSAVSATGYVSGRVMRE